MLVLNLLNSHLDTCFFFQIASAAYTNPCNSSIWSPASIDSYSLDQHQHRSWCSSNQPAVLTTNPSSTNCYNNYYYTTNMDYIAATGVTHSQFAVSVTLNNLKKTVFMCFIFRTTIQKRVGAKQGTIPHGFTIQAGIGSELIFECSFDQHNNFTNLTLPIPSQESRCANAVLSV